MKFLVLAVFALSVLQTVAQKIDSVSVPEGIVYKYCDPKIVEKTKSLVSKEFSDSTDYSLDNGTVIIGPVLWSRYKKISTLEAISGGEMTININNEKMLVNTTQDKEGFKKLWDQVATEVKTNGFKLRKAAYNELQYHRSVLPFDIEEPLLIVETSEHRFILSISPQELKLLWIDEVPTTIK